MLVRGCEEKIGGICTIAKNGDKMALSSRKNDHSLTRFQHRAFARKFYTTNHPFVIFVYLCVLCGEKG